MKEINSKSKAKIERTGTRALTSIYYSMDAGFEILNKEKEKDKKEIEEMNEWELFLQDRLIRIIPRSLLPYIKLIGLHYPDNIPIHVMEAFYKDSDAYGGWFQVRIPDFALITTYIDMKRNNNYSVFDPKKIQCIETEDFDWQELAMHQNIKDFRVALALAKQAWEFYLRDQEAGKATGKAEEAPNTKAEVYVPVDEEFQEPAEFFVDEYLGNQIDRRLKYHNLI